MNLPKLMEGQICLITGGTAGLGKATAFALPQEGANTFIVGRDRNRCEETVDKIKKMTGNSSVDYIVTDLSSFRDIHALSEEIKQRIPHLDVLINNVGAKFVKRHVTVDGYEMTFALNYLGHFLLTNLLLDLLGKSESARIINVSSGAHGGCSNINFNDLQKEDVYNGKYAYAQSKLANILFTYELSRRLAGKKISVNALHPGGVATNFCKNNGWISWGKHVTAHLLARNLVGPTEGAKTIIYLATSPEVEGISGKYFYNMKPVSSSQLSYDEDTARRLWDVSLRLTGMAKR